MTGDMDQLAGVCAGCGLPLAEDLPSWSSTINLTLDTFFVQDVCAVEFDEPVIGPDLAYDWCSLTCFGLSLFRAAVDLGWRSRP